MKSKYIVNIYSNGYFVNSIHGDCLTGCFDFAGNPLVGLWAGRTLVTTFGTIDGRDETLRVLSTQKTDSCFISILEYSIVNKY